MMDTRAHGESGGAMATYGWLEREDTRAVVDVLVVSEQPTRIHGREASLALRALLFRSRSFPLMYPTRQLCNYLTGF
jgi:hypothetical protein